MSKGTKGSALKGKFFHSVKANDRTIDWQGQIIDELAPGYFMLQLFSWLDGGPTDQIIVSFDDMHGWKFYDSKEAMVEAGNRLVEEREAQKRGAAGDCR